MFTKQKVLMKVVVEATRNLSEPPRDLGSPPTPHCLDEGTGMPLLSFKAENFHFLPKQFNLFDICNSK